MRVLLCPDKFRGTATAAQVSAAIETGWRRVRPGDTFITLPMADGGEGTLEALAGGEARRSEAVTGPLGDPVRAAWGLRADGTAVIEMATASGLALLDPSRRDPRRSTTRGTGELMRAALDAGAARILVCLGGSATNDGGTGMASALGVRFLDEEGRTLPDGGGALVHLTRIDLSGSDPRLSGVEVVGLCDVDNPLTGPAGASATYGPQKGADAETVWELDRALAHLAAVVQHDLGTDVSREPGAGAAGGLGFGLLAFAGARLRPGVEAVAEAVGLESAMAEADLVITGEGAFDATSLRGKVVGGVLATADVARRQAVVVCGRASVEAPPGVGVVALVDLVGEREAVGETRVSLERAGQVLAERA
jgi:glycerate kinase